LAKDAHSQLVIYRYFLQHLFKTISEAQALSPFDLIIASDASDLSALQKINESCEHPAPFDFIAHSGSHFNTNISSALSSGFAKGYKHVAIIGNDCLDLSANHLIDTFEQLKRGHSVLGNSCDGGFYLLGLSSFSASLFDNLCWGTNTVSSRLLENLKRAGHDIFLLPSLQDIDNSADLKRWFQNAQNKAASLISQLAALLNSLKSPAFISDRSHRNIIPQQLEFTHLFQLPPPLAQH